MPFSMIGPSCPQFFDHTLMGALRYQFLQIPVRFTRDARQREATPQHAQRSSRP